MEINLPEFSSNCITAFSGNSTKVILKLTFLANNVCEDGDFVSRMLELCGRRTEQVKTGQVNPDQLIGHFRGHFRGRLRGMFRGSFRGSP